VTKKKTKREIKELFQMTDIPDWMQPHKQDHSSLYTEETWAEILERVAGGESLTGICRDPRMPPNKSHLMKWILMHPERKEEYEFAQEVQAEFFSHDIINIADAVDNPMEDIQRSKLRIESRFRIMEVYSKSKYAKNADKTQINIKGGSGSDEPVKVEFISVQGGSN